MAASDVQDYQQVLTEYLYFFTKYIVANDFVDRLISERVLNLDDKELILNPYANQSRRERAAKLIEVLHTRGPYGYSKFLEILEYQYPHVFREVTKQEPRKPPPGFQRNRTSDQLHMINDLPRLAQHIKDQHHQNTDLQEELTVLQGLLEFSKEENAALERDLDAFKYVKQRNDDLTVQISNLENHNKELQTNINKEMQRTFKYIEERDEYQQKCQNIQLQYDQLYKKIKEREQEKEKPTGRGSLQEQPPSRPASITPEPTTVTERITLHTVAELAILRDELDGYKSHAEDISYRLQEANETIGNLENKVEKRTKELHIQMKENRNLEDQLKDAKLKSEAYYKLIHTKDEEINLLNSQKMSEQQRVTKLTQEKNEIFQEKHNMGIKLEQLRVELDKIKARLSGSNQDSLSGSNQDFSCPDIHDSEEDQNFDDDEVEQRRKHFRRRSIPGRWNREESSPDACFNNLTNLSVMADIDSCEMFKFNTLPVGSETPEMVFQREIAFFRYSKKNDRPRHKPLVLQDSITTHPGSMHVKDQSPRDPEIAYQKREFMSHTRDQSDKGSDSTVYVPRQQGQKQFSGRSWLEDSVKEDPESLLDSDVTSSSGGFSLIEDLPPYDLRTELIPKQCAQVTRQGAPDSLSYRTVTVKFPVVNDQRSEIKGAIEIVGGNHTGIFISKVLHKAVELLEGEEVKEIMYTPNDRAKPVEATLQGCTLEDAYRLLSEDYIRPRKERAVKLKVRKCRLEYDSACKWMAENKGTGDFLFIRCNANMEHRTSDDSVTPKAGDIFQVKNSRYSRKQWLGYRVNESTGSIDKAEIKIPNPVEASLRRLPSINHSFSEDGDVSSRRPAVRVRGVTYERVLPMKASVLLPVYVIGHSLVVNALLDLVSRQLSTEFYVKSSDAGSSNSVSELTRNDIHMVKRWSLDKMQYVKPYQRILVFVNVTEEIHPDIYSHIFGEEVGSMINCDVTTTSKALKQKITEGGYKFEELSLPEIKTRDKLLETFRRCVSCSQSRTLWLSSSEMDPMIANMYPRYLGHNCDLSNIMTAVQKAQSLDHS